jgi:hypothetical protein
MIKTVAVGIAIAWGSGVALAQSPPRKPAPHKRPAPASGDKKPELAPLPAPAPAPAAAASPPDATSDAAPVRSPGGPTAPPVMKTDEKAGTKLEKDAGAADRDVSISATDQNAALIAFHAGNDQLNNGLFPQAVAKYREALSHWDHPAIHYNLALALINLSQPVEVYDELTKAMAYGPDPLEKDKFDHAREYLKLVSGQLADIEVSCDKPGARVAVDGKEVFVAPGKFSAKVRVGKHTFVAEKQGYNARITAPFIGSAETFRIELKLYTAEELTRYRRKWQRTWVPYSVIGAGAVVGIIGGALELSARSSFQDFDSQVARCNADSKTNSGCAAASPGLQSLRDSGNTKRATGYVMYGIAGGAVLAGAVLAWINRPEAYQIRAEELAEPRVSVTPIVAPGMAGASVQGHF